MNNLKFRAWLKQEKKMVEVKSLHLSTRKIMYGYSNNSQSYGNKVMSFDDVILMQATGLKDINGKDIYEGDMIKGFDGAYDYEGYIKYNESYYDVVCDDYNRALDFMEVIEVIGNIYENEELVK